MLSINELSQVELPLPILTMFDYVTHGTSSDVEVDCVMLDEVELNFDN